MQKLITFKLGTDMLKQIDRISERMGFNTRAEFIRSAVRDKLDEARRKEALGLLEKNRGFAKNRNFSDEQIEIIREEVSKELAKELGV